MEQIFPKEEAEANSKFEIKLPFETTDDDADMISADKFYENRIRNGDAIKKHLLDLAKKLVKEALKTSYDSELAYDTIGDMKKIRIVVTICQYGRFYDDGEISTFGEYDIWYNIMTNGLFPKSKFKKWLQSFGWQLDCHSDDCEKDEIWLDLVSRPFI